MRKFSIVLVVSFLFGCTTETVESHLKEERKTISDSKTTEEDHSVKILFAGDLLLDRGVKEVIEKKGVNYLFESVNPIVKMHDYFVVNLETPVTNIHAPLNKKYVFRSNPEHLPALKKYGVTQAILSNNHSMDQNKDGLEDTYINLKKEKIESIGYGGSIEESCAPTILKKGSHTIAIFGSVQVPIENWFPLDHKPAVCQLKGEELVEEIRQYKSENPSHKIVVTLHWGMEYISTPYGAQQNHARNLIDAGSDLIVGHHPHVIQSVEIYKEKLIYYSIGNFIFDSKNPKSKKGLLVSFVIDENGNTSTYDFPFTIEDCRPLPKNSL